jgi:hypothetical protein
VLFSLGLLAMTACQPTEIAFANDLPGAKLENVKWKPPGETYSAEGALSPGETSESVYLYEEDVDASGVVEFDLVQNGRRVHLITREKFTAIEGETKVFTIREDTPVDTGLSE